MKRVVKLLSPPCQIHGGTDCYCVQTKTSAKSLPKLNHGWNRAEVKRILSDPRVQEETNSPKGKP